MMTTRRPLDSVARRTFCSTGAGARASLTPASNTKAAAAAPIRRSGRIQPNTFMRAFLSLWRRQVRDQRLLAIDLVQRLCDRGRGHHDAAVLRVVEAEIATETVDVAIEHSTDHLPLRVDRRRAGIAADDVVVGGEVEHRLRVQLL